MSTVRVGLVGLMLLAGLSACGTDYDELVAEETSDTSMDAGQSASRDVLFAADDADTLAHAALLDAADLGPGWEVIGRDQFDDDDSDFEAAMVDEPACATLAALDGLDGLGAFFGDGDEEELPAGRANIEMEHPTPDSNLPTTVELSVEIEETVGEILGGWGLAQELMSSDDFAECMLAVMPKSFAESDMPEGMTVDVSLRELSAPAPNDGVTMGFDLDMAVGAIELNMAMEMYMWPYGNAGVMAMFIGDQVNLDTDLIGSTLSAFEQQLADAADS